MQHIYVSNTILNLTRDICTYPGDNCVFNHETGRLAVYRAGDLLSTTDEVSEGAIRAMLNQKWLTEVKPERIQAPYFTIASNPVVDLDEPIQDIELLVDQIKEEERPARRGKKTKPAEPEPAEQEALEA